jgi:hypothetical protein
LSDVSGLALTGYPGVEEIRHRTLWNIASSIEELMLAMRSVDHFILEQAPLKSRVPKKGRLLRSHDRARYILLKPEAIRRKMGLQASADRGQRARGVRRPHERRRHWRTLKSERFTRKRGERILVEAHWVGPAEAVVGKSRYRVRLDI